MKFSDTGPFALVPEWVLRAPVTDGAVRYYAVLSRYADNESGECWPARKTLAEQMSRSTDSIDRLNRELVEIGALTIEHRRNDDGGPTSNLYRLNRLRPDPGREDAATVATDGAASPSRDGAARTRPSSELDLENTRDQKDREPYVADFDAWWALYPRKIDKRRAYRKYVALRKTKAAGMREALLAAVTNYAAEMERCGTDVQFVKHAATFLGDSWAEWSARPAPPPRQVAAPDLPEISRTATRSSATDPSALA